MAGHERDVKRERFWREVLARRTRSGLTVCEFCAKEGLVATTYQHRRREKGRTPASSPVLVEVAASLAIVLV